MEQNLVLFFNNPFSYFLTENIDICTMSWFIQEKFSLIDLT